MRLVLLSLMLMCICTGGVYAQNSILAGILTDEYGVPVKGATLRVSKAGKAIEAISDDDGLFYTRLLPSGTYHLDVITDRKMLNAKRIYLPPTNKKRVFFYIKVVDDHVRISADGQDPFMKNKLGKIEADADNNGGHGHMFIIRSNK